MQIALVVMQRAGHRKCTPSGFNNGKAPLLSRVSHIAPGGCMHMRTSEVAMAGIPDIQNGL